MLTSWPSVQFWCFSSSTSLLIKIETIKFPKPDVLEIGTMSWNILKFEHQTREQERDGGLLLLWDWAGVWGGKGTKWRTESERVRETSEQTTSPLIVLGRRSLAWDGGRNGDRPTWSVPGPTPCTIKIKYIEIRTGSGLLYGYRLLLKKILRSRLTNYNYS